MKLAPGLIACLLLTSPVEDPIEVDFAVLSGFEYHEGMTLPASVTRYDEKVVTVSGFMRREEDLAPTGGDVDYFALVNDACGCAGTPKMNEIVFCAMPEGKTTPILSGLAHVTGKLYVGEAVEDDVVVAIYQLDVDRVERNGP